MNKEVLQSVLNKIPHLIYPPSPPLPTACVSLSKGCNSGSPFVHVKQAVNHAPQRAHALPPIDPLGRATPPPHLFTPPPHHPCPSRFPYHALKRPKKVLCISNSCF